MFCAWTKIIVFARFHLGDRPVRRAPGAIGWAACLLWIGTAGCSDEAADPGSATTTTTAATTAGTTGSPASTSGPSTTGGTTTGGNAGSSTSTTGAGPTNTNTTGGGGVTTGLELDAGGTDSSATDSSTTPSGTCTRELLSSTLDTYFAALAAHDPSQVPLATDVKYTEKGVEMNVGEGMWQTAGAVAFQRAALDTQTCTVVAESVVPDGDTDLVYGVRLKLVEQQITEIETLPVEEGDYFGGTEPASLISTADDDWETLLAEADRPTREEMSLVIERYFRLFPAGGCNFGDCERRENGRSYGSCSSFLSCSDTDPATVTDGMIPRLHVLDVEAGIAVGFVMWMGDYIDFHMFKIRGGEVVGVHAVLAEADSSGWD